MTDSELIAYAAEWGSYVRAGDPGWCMYGFSPEIGLKVQSEYHRECCLEYLSERMHRVENNPDDYDDDEWDRLHELLEAIAKAPNLEDQG